MKIFCIDKNYAPQEKPQNPILYMKPETALTREDWPFFVPDWSQQVECEAHLAVRINHLGKSIPVRFAHRYYDEITVGLSFVARDVQNNLISNGLPWEISTGFDGASYVGKWVKLTDLGAVRKEGEELPDITFSASLNGQKQVENNSAKMLHSIDEIISFVSQYYLLKTGDIILCGAPASFGPLHETDLITASLADIEVLQCRCK